MATKQVEAGGPALETLDDDALIRQYAAQGDRDALETLFRRHADAAYATALRICRHAADAQDAVQHAFFKVMKNAAAYRGGSEAAAKVWIMQIVVGTCKNRIRSEVRRRKWEELASVEQDAICLPEDSSATEETRILATAVLQQLNGLPEHYRMPILLHHCQGMSLKETATTLSVSENTLHMQLKRGIDKLRESLAAQGAPASLASIMAVLPLMPADAAPAPLLASLSDIAHGVGNELAHTALPGAGAAARSIPAAVKWAVAALVLIGAGTAGVMRLPHPPPPATPVSAKSFHYHWDFNSPDLPREFLVLRGAIRQVPGMGENGKGALDVSNAMVQIDIPITHFPFLVSFKLRAYQPEGRVGDTQTDSQWLPTREAAILLNASQVPNERASPDRHLGEWHTYNNYYTGNCLSQWTENRFHDIYIQPMEPDGRVTLRMEPRVLLDQLTIRSIPAGEVPDVSIYENAIAKIPPEKRKGEVPLPEIKPGRREKNDGQPVRVRFYKNVSAYGQGTVEN